eukprot:gene23604-biopygen10363
MDACCLPPQLEDASCPPPYHGRHGRHRQAVSRGRRALAGLCRYEGFKKFMAPCRMYLTHPVYHHTTTVCARRMHPVCPTRRARICESNMTQLRYTGRRLQTPKVGVLILPVVASGGSGPGDRESLEFPKFYGIRGSGGVGCGWSRTKSDGIGCSRMESVIAKTRTPGHRLESDGVGWNRMESDRIGWSRMESVGVRRSPVVLGGVGRMRNALRMHNALRMKNALRMQNAEEETASYATGACMFLHINSI